VTQLLWRLASSGGDLVRRLGRPGRPDDDGETAELAREAEAARRDHRPEEAAALYRRILRRQRSHAPALRGLRELAAESGRWHDAVEAQQKLLASVPATERVAETERLAVLHYRSGRADLERGNAAGAILQLKSAVRVDRRFVPATIALGEAQALAGDRREAMRTWERAAEIQPSLPLLARLERAYREEGRPTRMIALYRAATERAPDDLALALALGRVYLELEMLDEAADQLEKVEVRAPDAAMVHAYLGGVFERRGDSAAALEEYRRALRLGRVFEWPFRCSACTGLTSTWQDHCPRCGRWNALHPSRDGRV
jgi:lipopolysaccharide biosynthesis regulator YciM